MNARAALLSVLLAAISACSTTPPEPGPAYPDITQLRTLDIHVQRDVRTITLTNTTAIDLPPGRMWVNKWFSRDMPQGLPVAKTVTFDLGEFVDEFGERFRAGGFFAINDPDDLVLAQYHTTTDAGDPIIYGLIVIDGRIE